MFSFFRTISSFFGILSLSIFLFVLSSQFYGVLQKYTIEESRLVSTEFRIEKNRSIVSYWISSHLEFRDADFTVNERLHLQDVKLVLLGFFIVGVIGGVGSLLIPGRKNMGAIFLVRLGVGVLVILLSLVGYFELIFELFHRLFFDGNWQFSSDSLLIQLYPEPFFQYFGIVIWTACLLILGFDYLLRRHYK